MKSITQELIKAVSETYDYDLLQKSLEDGFNINTQNEKGCTLLMFATMPNPYNDPNSTFSLRRMIEFLLKNGANSKILDSFGMTAIDYLKQHLDSNWLSEYGFPANNGLSDFEIDELDQIIELLRK